MGRSLLIHSLTYTSVFLLVADHLSLILSNSTGHNYPRISLILSLVVIWAIDKSFLSKHYPLPLWLKGLAVYPLIFKDLVFTIFTIDRIGWLDPISLFTLSLAFYLTFGFDTGGPLLGPPLSYLIRLILYFLPSFIYPLILLKAKRSLLKGSSPTTSPTNLSHH